VQTANLEIEQLKRQLADAQEKGGINQDALKQQIAALEEDLKKKSDAPKTKTIIIYDNKIIPQNCGISTGTYTKIDGYRYVNIAVEFEQKEGTEEPISLGVVFAYSSNGKFGARRYFTFDDNFTLPPDPQMITISGKSSWHGHPYDKSSYIARLPVMGPFIQVFPFNHHDEERKLSISLYLTN
jgi:hypothetical protein